jgi:hypothetical protein
MSPESRLWRERKWGRNLYMHPTPPRRTEPAIYSELEPGSIDPIGHLHRRGTAFQRKSRCRRMPFAAGEVLVELSPQNYRQSDIGGKQLESPRGNRVVL